MSRARALLSLLLAGCAAAPNPNGAADDAWQPLFDGASLHGLQVTDFGGQGAVTVHDGTIVLGMGSPLTGVQWTGEFPTSGYRLEVTATRGLGHDFFCGLTFPIGDQHATFVLGGWGGNVVGLSCIDGDDAAHNPTRTTMAFDTDRPYRIRIEVTATAVRGYVDDRCVVDVARAGHTFSLRAEVVPSRPLGIACYLTESALRNWRWCRLAD